MEYKFYSFTEGMSWEEEERFLNYQAEVGWRVVAVVVPGPTGTLLLERKKSVEISAQIEEEEEE